MLTMAEVMRIPPLDGCSVIAGHRGLTRRVQSVNSFDAPDVVPWYKAGELVLTTGYVIRNDEVAQVKLVQQMAQRNCAGLGIKVNHFSSEFSTLLLQAAEEHDLPLFEIPGHLSLSDLVFPLLRELFTFQDRHKEQTRRKRFFAGLLQEEWTSRDEVLARGKEFGVLPGHGFICIYVSQGSPHSGDRLTDPRRLPEFIHFSGENTGVDWMMSQPGDAVIILQSPLEGEACELPVTARKLAGDLIDHRRVSDSEGGVIIGIGTYQDDVMGISTSYRKAREAARLGCRVAPPRQARGI
ncbi:PucR family transcriptional regulator [Kroppenstedtia eburnea]|uniref:Purine catabolism regulatory protein-like family protein n=1 Tax=Kroppenstedtia eburnea TaxID=714067 RepID=A0A1N7IZ22_9BACL|nr:PucR family transcriptional regulator ligand-binding domain-containing protein [Kroppenstedtia eburnea]QKI82350.1 hypothetical protein GXN75_10255 [Kroppenstedtia eburnea]SIS42382.1 Purine catabolism regulatory protein-like family protein [Kroppenstedtia eburnea]